MADNKQNYKSLPIRPTDQMIEAAYPLLSGMKVGTPSRDRKLVLAIYAEMVESAPKPIIQGLTRRQAEVHQFIENYIAEHNCSPTYAEIAGGINIVGKRGGRDRVYVIVKALERKGILKRRTRNQPRSIVVLVPTGLNLKKSKRK